jgi:hypothetical protein
VIAARTSSVRVLIRAFSPAGGASRSSKARFDRMAPVTLMCQQADVPDTPARRGFWSVDTLAVVSLVATAAALRVEPLGPHSLWLDDAWVSLLSKVHTVSDVRRISVASPGFVALLKTWFGVVGFSSLRAQTPAFLFGIFGPPALYLTARSWRLGRGAALLAGGLLAVSPVHMRYSARVKAFTLEALAAAVVLLIADRLLSEPVRRTRWYAFAFAAVVATMFSAPLVIVCVPGFAAAFLAVRRANEPLPRAALGATGGYVLFSLGWYVVAIRGAIDRNLVDYWNKYYISHRSIGDFVSSTARGFTRVAHGFDVLPSVVTLAALAACLVWMSRARPDRAVLLFGPIAIAAGIAVLHRNPFGGGRTDIYLYANLALILACGADVLFARIPSLVTVAATMAVIVTLGTVSLPVPAYPKEDFRAMLEAVKRDFRPTDSVLLYPKARFAAVLYTNWPFHLRGPVPGASVTTPFDLEIDRPRTFVPIDTTPVHFASSVAGAVASSRRVWYVGTHGGPDYDRAGVLLRRAGFTLRRRRGFAPHYFAQLWTRPISRPEQ